MTARWAYMASVKLAIVIRSSGPGFMRQPRGKAAVSTATAPAAPFNQPPSTAPQKRQLKPSPQRNRSKKRRHPSVVGEPLQQLMPVARALHARPGMLTSHVGKLPVEGDGSG